jgi:hypothetical protein
MGNFSVDSIYIALIHLDIPIDKLIMMSFGSRNPFTNQGIWMVSPKRSNSHQDNLQGETGMLV